MKYIDIHSIFHAWENKYLKTLSNLNAEICIYIYGNLVISSRCDMYIRSVTQSCLTLCNPMDCRLPCPSPAPGAYSDSYPSSLWYHPTISSSVVPFFSRLKSFPESGSFPMSQSSHQVAKVLEFQLLYQSFQWIFRTDFLQNGLVGSPCSPRDSLESSPTPQFKSINSSVLSFPYSSTLTSIHDYWKNHSFD